MPLLLKEREQSVCVCVSSIEDSKNRVTAAEVKKEKLLHPKSLLKQPVISGDHLARQAPNSHQMVSHWLGGHWSSPV